MYSLHNFLEDNFHEGLFPAQVRCNWLSLLPFRSCACLGSPGHQEAGSQPQSALDTSPSCFGQNGLPCVRAWTASMSRSEHLLPKEAAHCGAISSEPRPPAP